MMEETQHAKRTRRTAAEIKQLLEEFKHSGFNAADFCKSIGISEGVFYKWRSRYAEKPALEQNGFVNLRALSDGLVGQRGVAAVLGDLQRRFRDADRLVHLAHAHERLHEQ